MNPGPVEEGAKVATSVIENLKGEPISLALIVMNIIFVGAVSYAAYGINVRTTNQYAVKDALIEKLIDQCNKARSGFLAPPLTDPSRSEQP